MRMMGGARSYALVPGTAHPRAGADVTVPYPAADPVGVLQAFGCCVRRGPRGPQVRGFVVCVFACARFAPRGCDLRQTRMLFKCFVIGTGLRQLSMGLVLRV